MRKATIKELLDELKSEECYCGRTKKPRNTFCYKCYRSLPRDMQLALYDGIGAGYEEAVEAAHKYLSD